MELPTGRAAICPQRHPPRSYENTQSVQHGRCVQRPAQLCVDKFWKRFASLYDTICIQAACGTPRVLVNRTGCLQGYGVQITGGIPTSRDSRRIGFWLNENTYSSTPPCELLRTYTSVGSVYANQKGNSDQTSLVPILNIWVIIVGG